ncbi:MAG: dipeptidase [Kiritimatiellia bacterium]|jgi:membrane dipeptidase
MNAKMQEARQAALDILQPDQRTLEHARELHRDAVVIDTYGFGPNPAGDMEMYQAAIDRGLSDVEIKDLGEGMAMLRQLTDQAEQAEYKDAWDESGVTCIVRNAGEESQAPLVLLKRLARFVHVTDVLRDFVPKAVTADDIIAAHKAGRHCICLTGNGTPLAQEWRFVTAELAWIKVFHQLGIRMMHLTYNRRNMLGDGCAEESNAGLSEFGRHAIAEMNRVGVIVDVAHSGWRTSMEAAQVSSRPIVASHTVCDALNHHCRAKPDEVIRAILDGGGMLGICCISSFLGGAGDIAALLDHIDYMVKKFGADSVGIGTDTHYQSSSRPRQAPPPKKPRPPRFEAYWPPTTFTDPRWEQPQHKLSLDWINWPMFTVGMVQRGHSDETIRKILGGNFLRVLQANAVVGAL